MGKKDVGKTTGWINGYWSNNLTGDGWMDRRGKNDGRTD